MGRDERMIILKVTCFVAIAGTVAFLGASLFLHSSIAEEAKSQMDTRRDNLVGAGADLLRNNPDLAEQIRAKLNQQQDPLVDRIAARPAGTSSTTIVNQAPGLDPAGAYDVNLSEKGESGNRRVIVRHAGE
jgi:hypothetical protein